MRALSHGKLFRFTPAGTETRPDRAVTVAVRVNDDTSRVVSVRQAFAAAATAPGAATVRIAPTAYNLGLARGYQSFAIDEFAAAQGKSARLEMPDFQAFRPARADGAGSAVAAAGTGPEGTRRSRAAHAGEPGRLSGRSGRQLSPDRQSQCHGRHPLFVGA